MFGIDKCLYKLSIRSMYTSISKWEAKNTATRPEIEFEGFFDFRRLRSRTTSIEEGSVFDATVWSNKEQGECAELSERGGGIWRILNKEYM